MRVTDRAVVVCRGYSSDLVTPRQPRYTIGHPLPLSGVLVGHSHFTPRIRILVSIIA